MDKDLYEWKSSYNLGVEDIDLQHHYFLNLINRIISEIRTSDSTEFIVSSIDELYAYAQFHFLSELNIMRRAGYPYVEEHKTIHIKLLDLLGVKGGELNLEVTQKSAEEVVVFLFNWFIDHTLNEDRKFALFLHKREKESDN